VYGPKKNGPAQTRGPTTEIFMLFENWRMINSTNQSGAAEAWWAHNPQVPGSKPGSDIPFIFFDFFLTCLNDVAAQPRHRHISLSTCPHLSGCIHKLSAIYRQKTNEKVKTEIQKSKTTRKERIKRKEKRQRPLSNKTPGPNPLNIAIN